MVKFELNGVQYQTPASWSEVTFEKFLNYLSNVVPAQPKALKDWFASEDLSSYWNDMKPSDKAKCFDFFAISVAFWCDLDSKNVRNSLNLEQLQQAFYAIQLDLDIHNIKEDVEFTGFLIGNKEFLLPRRNMIGSTVAEFAEAAQFQENMQDLENGHWFSMLDVMVVLCKPAGEVYEYEETKHEMRKKMFKKKVFMDSVLQVAFFLLRQNKQLKQDLLIYSMFHLVKQRKEQKHFQEHMDGQF